MAAIEHAKRWILLISLAGVSVPALGQPAEPEAPEAPEAPAGEAEAPLAEPGADPSAVGEVQAEPDAAAAAEAPPAEGEAAAAEGEQPSGGEDEDIVVTGSRLKRTSFDAPSPVQVVDRAALAKSGAANMRDVVAALPVNYGAENNAGIGSGARGTSQFNLHGLGPGATLVLLNGRRIIRTGLTVEGQPFDDVTQIPLPLVERVEVMKGGASAIYGSDAVAGVVNVITRRKYNGVDVQLSGNMATRSGGLRDGQVALTMGSASDTSGIGVSLVYYDRTALLGNERPYSSGDPGLAAWNFDMPLPATGIPMGYARPTNLSQQGNPASFVFEIPNAMAGMPSMYVTRADPLCLSPIARANGSYQQGNNCGFDFTQYYNYVYPEERFNVYSTMEHDFSSNLTGFAEVGYMRQSLENPLSPSYSLSKGLYVPANHPDLPAEFSDTLMMSANAAMARQLETPGIRISGRTRGGAWGPMPQRTRVDNFRVVAGLRGSFEGLVPQSILEDWDWELSATYHDYQFIDRSQDDIGENLQRALDACSPDSPDHANQNGGVQQIPCWHPFYAQSSLNATDVNNKLGISADTYIRGSTITHSNVSMVVGDGMLRGTLAPLPGGRLGFALGAQVRHNEIEWRPDRDGQLQRYVFLIGTPAYAASNNIFAGYGEIGAPFFRGFELQGAVRYEHYSDVGGSTTPKIGLSYSPFVTMQNDALKGLHLRGAFATSFRGPSLLQTQGRQVQLSQFQVGTAAVFRPQTTIGNANLEPETSTALNVGLDWHFGGFQLESEYWRYTYKKQVVKEDGTAIWRDECQPLITMQAATTPAAAVAAANATGSCRGVQLSQDGQLQGVEVNFINAGESSANGIDVSANFRFGDADAAGVFGVGANLSYLLSYKTANKPGVALVERAGSRNALNFAPSLPRVHLSVPINWSLLGHSLQATGKFVSSYTNDADPLINYAAMPPAPIMGSARPIDSWFTLDLQYSFTTKALVGKASTFTLGAINALDADPPFVYTNLGYDGTQHDARGRMLYARLGQEF